jgi:hypothetical protein
MSAVGKACSRTTIAGHRCGAAQAMSTGLDGKKRRESAVLVVSVKAA